MTKLLEQCGTCNSMRWCGRQCAAWKKMQAASARIDEVMTPEVAANVERLATRKYPDQKSTHPSAAKGPRGGERPSVGQLQAQADRLVRPSAHPDCQRCKWDTQQAQERMRKRRGKQ